jgi:hypothetical protein
MTIQSAETIDGSLKKIRTFHVVSIASIPLLAYSGEVLSPAKTSGVTAVGLLLIALAIFDIWSAFSWRRRRLQKACQVVLMSPGDAGAVRRWHHANLILLIGCESLALYGCLLRVWGGGTLPQAVPFYICALILLLVYTPDVSLFKHQRTRIREPPASRGACILGPPSGTSGHIPVRRCQLNRSMQHPITI